MKRMKLILVGTVLITALSSCGLDRPFESHRSGPDKKSASLQTAELAGEDIEEAAGALDQNRSQASTRLAKGLVNVHIRIPFDRSGLTRDHILDSHIGQLCSGAIVRDRYVVTAAHCLQSQDNRLKTVKMADIRIPASANYDHPDIVDWSTETPDSGVGSIPARNVKILPGFSSASDKFVTSRGLTAIRSAMNIAVIDFGRSLHRLGYRSLSFKAPAKNLKPGTNLYAASVRRVPVPTKFNAFAALAGSSNGSATASIVVAPQNVEADTDNFIGCDIRRSSTPFGGHDGGALLTSSGHVIGVLSEGFIEMSASQAENHYYQHIQYPDTLSYNNSLSRCVALRSLTYVAIDPAAVNQAIMELYTSPAKSTIALAPLVNDAKVTEYRRVRSGTEDHIFITMKNTGSRAWTSAYRYQLRTPYFADPVNSEGNKIFWPGDLSFFPGVLGGSLFSDAFNKLRFAATDYIAPGQQKTFRLTLPYNSAFFPLVDYVEGEWGSGSPATQTTDGVFDFRWSLIADLSDDPGNTIVQRFGETSASDPIVTTRKKKQPQLSSSVDAGVCLTPPTEEQMLSTLPADIRTLASLPENPYRFSYVTDFIASYADSCFQFPGVGLARMYHCNYKITTYFDDSALGASSWHKPNRDVISRLNTPTLKTYLSDDKLIPCEGARQRASFVRRVDKVATAGATGKQWRFARPMPTVSDVEPPLYSLAVPATGTGANVATWSSRMLAEGWYKVAAIYDASAGNASCARYAFKSTGQPRFTRFASLDQRNGLRDGGVFERTTADLTPTAARYIWVSRDRKVPFDPVNPDTGTLEIQLSDAGCGTASRPAGALNAAGLELTFVGRNIGLMTTASSGSN